MIHNFKVCYLLIFSLLIFHISAITNIVAAENFYGELAQEIGGPYVHVNSIINNPNADPHLFTTSVATSIATAQANIIIYNGADYDPWMKQIIANINSKKIIIIDVAQELNIPSGVNPHIWYKESTFPIIAKILAAHISTLNPTGKTYIQGNLTQFLKQYQQINQIIQHIQVLYHGTLVIATEPVFNYMTSRMGLDMRGQDFQWKVMNDTEPSPTMISQYENLLKTHQVKVLFYNNQVHNSITQNMKKLAQKNGIPIVGVSETIQPNMTIHTWLLNEVNSTIKALQ